MITAQQLAAEFLAAAVRTNAAVARVVSKGAVNVKNETKRNIRASAGRSAHVEAFINYDVDNQGVRVSAEIGYDKSFRPAALGNLLEFGGGGDKSPPHRDLGRALDSEEPRFVTAMQQIGNVVIP